MKPIALILIVGSVLKFYVVFLNILVFQTIWWNKNEHQKQNKDKEGEEGVSWQEFEKVYGRTILF